MFHFTVMAHECDHYDALIDLTYVAMGTAYMMGLPWQDLWDEVQRANMSKVRAKFSCCITADGQ